MNEVTVIIPVYKPGKEFPELIRRLKEQETVPVRILIVNTEERFFPEELSEKLSGDPAVSVLHIGKKDFDHGGTRDMAAGMCSSEFLLFMTMDALPADRHLVSRLLACFKDPKTAAAYARQLPRKDARAAERLTRDFNYGPESIVKTEKDLGQMGIKTFFCSNVCAMYRRETYMALGGFEKKTIFNEDMIFAGRLIQNGYAIAYCAQARVIHSHNYSAIMQLRRNFDLGVSQADHPEIFGSVASEGEGIRLVTKTAGRLIRTGHFLSLPSFILQSGCKYVGYRLGKAYRRLPCALIRRLTMNGSYWDEDEEDLI